MKTTYAIRQVGTTDKFIGFDENSGGYPFVTDFLGAGRSRGITYIKPEIPNDSYLSSKGEKYEVVEIEVKATAV